MALQFVTQPVSQVVDQSVSSVTFSTSAIEPLSGFLTVNYQWRTKDANGSTYSNLSNGSGIAGATTRALTLAPIANFDNDLFIAVANVTANGTTQSVSSLPATFAIRLSGDKYSEWETLTETGVNRVRRLQVLGYL